MLDCNDWVWQNQSNHLLSVKTLKDKQIRYYIDKETYRVERYYEGMENGILSDACKDLETAKRLAAYHFQYLVNRSIYFHRYTFILNELENEYNESVSKLILSTEST